MAKLMIDRTFVRVGGQNLSERQMSHVDLTNWVAEWYSRRGLYYHQTRVERTPEQREELLAQMVRNGCPPVMLGDDSGEEVARA